MGKKDVSKRLQRNHLAESKYKGQSQAEQLLYLKGKKRTERERTGL